MDMKVNVSELVAIPRSKGRNSIGWKESVPFHGSDIWNAYEFSFLKPDGKPTAGVLTIEYDSDSPAIVESKSLKLYLNSYSMSHFSSIEEVLFHIQSDLENILGTQDVQLLYETNSSFTNNFTDNSKFLCIDNLEVEKITDYTPNAKLLKVAPSDTSDHFFCSHLLKSNCPLTNQPDWGSVYLYFQAGSKTVKPESLLKYIISYRLHNEYHEECCERILYDLLNILKPQKIALICKYTRRGGIDINPIRIFPRDISRKEIPYEFTQLVYTRDFHQ